MIDREGLEAGYKLAVKMCMAILTAPALLVFISVIMAAPAEPGGPGSGTAKPAILIVLLALALSPVVSVPIARRLLMPSAAASQGFAPARSPEAGLFLLAITEFALCEISVFMGFVGFIAGGPWAFLLAGVGLTLLGFFLTFPRRSVWLARADAIEPRGAFAPIDPA